MATLTRILCCLIFVALTACGMATPPPAALPVSTIPAASAPATTAIPLPTDPPAATATTSPTSFPEFVDPTIKSQVDQLAAYFLGQGRNPGLGIAIVLRDPQTGALQAMLLNYGTSAKDGGEPVTSDTVYEIGSITKVFTGILLAESVNSGAARLDDPIQKYLPVGVQAPAYKDVPITLDDLATHRSALPRDPGTDDMSQVYSWLNTYRLGRAPGSEYAYSNLGYSLLGDMLARLSDTDYGTLEYQAVSHPLGLEDTRETLTPEEASRLAQGYRYDGSLADYFPDSGAMSGAAYLHSTLNDMTRFLIDNLQANATPLGASISLAQTLQAAGRNPGTGAALGWDINDLGTTTERLSKGGASMGFTSYITLMHDGSSGFVLLSNGMGVESLVPHMLKILDVGN